jgi:hypothetical protein
MAYYNIMSDTIMYLDHIQEDNEIRAKGVVSKALALWKSQGGRRHIEGSYGVSDKPVLGLVKAEGREGLSANRLGLANNGVSNTLPLPALPAVPSMDFSTALTDQSTQPVSVPQATQETLKLPRTGPPSGELPERFEECAEHEEDSRD